MYEILSSSLIKDLRTGNLEFGREEIVQSGDYEEIFLTEYWLSELGFEKIQINNWYFYSKVMLNCYQITSNMNYEAKEEGWHIQGANEEEVLRMYTVSDFQWYSLHWFNIPVILAKDPSIRKSTFPTVIVNKNNSVDDMNLLVYLHATRIVGVKDRQMFDCMDRINNKCIKEVRHDINYVRNREQIKESHRRINSGITYISRLTPMSKKRIMIKVYRISAKSPVPI